MAVGTFDGNSRIENGICLDDYHYRQGNFVDGRLAKGTQINRLNNHVFVINYSSSVTMEEFGKYMWSPNHYYEGYFVINKKYDFNAYYCVTFAVMVHIFCMTIYLKGHFTVTLPVLAYTLTSMDIMDDVCE